MTKELIIVVLILVVIYLYWRQKDTSFGLTERLYCWKIENLQEEFEIVREQVVEITKYTRTLEADNSVYKKYWGKLENGELKWLKISD